MLAATGVAGAGDRQPGTGERHPRSSSACACSGFSDGADRSPPRIATAKARAIGGERHERRDAPTDHAAARHDGQRANILKAHRHPPVEHRHRRFAAAAVVTVAATAVVAAIVVVIVAVVIVVAAIATRRRGVGGPDEITVDHGVANAGRQTSA